ncbi:MAG: energy transducer TonB, partial [Sneathiellaceae bacterium]
PPGRPPDRAPAATAAAPATAATVPAAARDSPAPAGSPGTAPGAAAETADGPAMSGSAGTVADQGAGTGGAADPSLLGGYFGRIRAILERNRRYPPQAQAMRQQGVVVLAFALDREGRLLDWRILQTSGHRLLDAEAVDLLRRVAPLPPFPAGIGGDRLDLEVPIRFDL